MIRELILEGIQVSPQEGLLQRIEDQTVGVPASSITEVPGVPCATPVGPQIGDLGFDKDGDRSKSSGLVVDLGIPSARSGFSTKGAEGRVLAHCAATLCDLFRSVFTEIRVVLKAPCAIVRHSLTPRRTV